MVEACTPSASATVVSEPVLADTEPIVVVEISQQTIRKAGETIWVLLNKEPTELSVVLSDGDFMQPIECVKLYEKLLIFTVPHLKEVHDNGIESSETNLVAGDAVEGKVPCDPDSSQDAGKIEATEGEVTIETSKPQDSAAVKQPAEAEQPSSNVDIQPPVSEALSWETTTLVETVQDAYGQTTKMPQKIILQCGEQQIVLPVTFQYDSMDSGDREHNDSRAAQISSLFSFATDGDPLALLTPLVHLLSECDSDGCNALHLAARNKQNFALKTLLTALRESCESNEAVAILNARNARGQTPLHCAVRAGDADCVHYLLSAGARNNIPDNNFNTVIHYLGEVYNDDIYKEILEQSHAEGSTDPNNTNNCSAESPLASKNSDGYTPAHIAVQKLKLGLLEALVEVGAPIDVPDSNGETPLISAVLMDDVETASLLLMNKCNANAVSKCSDTPLGIACRRKNLVLIGRLLDAGADPQLLDKYGKMPAECEDEEVQRILHGERVQTEEPTREAVVNGETSQAVGHGADDDEDALLSYRMRAINADDVSCLDYLTRLRLAKLLDADEKWISLAENLGCGHMVEFIRVCTDDASSPTMILLDQYEQMPNANLATVAQSLEDMGETTGVRLLRSGNEHE
uniref:Nuclear factor NF-kappa-B p105 subunit n=2 Tax=Ascaris suum TaxID=6253 RepID=F1KWT2_ASCSU